MNPSKRAMLLCLVLAGASARARAQGQEVQEVEKGQRVRVTTSTGDRLIGRLAEKTPSTLRVELEEDGGSRSVPLADVARLETGRRRSRSQGAWAKAKWGALHPGEDWIQVSPRVDPARSEVSLSITLSF